MTILEAIILGIIQGLSEFIPISSTAHLTIAGHYFGLIDPDHPEKWTAFIAVIQLGTLAAVLIYFASEINDTIKSFFKENYGSNKKSFKEQSSESKLGWFVILGSIPIMTIGLGLKDFIRGTFTKDLNVIGISLIVLGVILFLAERVASLDRDMKKLNIWDSLLVGLAQCVALIPGSSRSGTTITAGLFLGLKRETAARFSFLLGIPAIFGSGLYEFYSEFSNLSQDDLLTLAVATIFSGISGWLAIDFLLKYLRKKSTLLFVLYRIGAGSLVLIISRSI